MNLRSQLLSSTSLTEKILDQVDPLFFFRRLVWSPIASLSIPVSEDPQEMYGDFGFYLIAPKHEVFRHPTQEVFEHRPMLLDVTPVHRDDTHVRRRTFGLPLLSLPFFPGR